MNLPLEDPLVEDAPGEVIDLTGTSYLDSAGLRLLYMIADRLGARRRALHLVAPEQAPIVRLLELVDIPRRVKMYIRGGDSRRSLRVPAVIPPSTQRCAFGHVRSVLQLDVQLTGAHRNSLPAWQHSARS